MTELAFRDRPEVLTGPCLIGLKDRPAYCATKGPVVAPTRQLVLQYSQTRIRCNCGLTRNVASPWVRRLTEHSTGSTPTYEALIARQRSDG